LTFEASETHTSPQAARPVVVQVHVPLVQTCPLPHVLPQAPQLAASLLAMQASLQ
jgi:hypothetical protein